MVRIFICSIIVALAASLPSLADEAGCNVQPGCGTGGGCPAGCCCPHCGCHEGLVPICHPYCEMKKVTKYKYCCVCEDKCVPSCCFKLGVDSGCGCECCCDSCGHCMVREVKKLVKIPYTEEVPVKKCRVEWVCPQCHCECAYTGEQSMPAATAAAAVGKTTSADTSAPLPPALPPPPLTAQ